MVKNLKKTISIICAVCLLFGVYPDISASAAPNPATYSAAAGSGSAVFDFPNAKISEYANYGTDQLVINIQDFHSDYNTQLIIANLLETISASDRNIEIYIEGAHKDVNSNYLKSLKNFPNFDGFAATLLKNDKITGAEYFALQHDNTVLRGLEDEKLHLKNIKNLASLIENRNKVLSEFDVYYENANQAIYSLLNKESKRLLKKKQSHEAGILSDKEYLNMLAEYAGKYEIDCRTLYPNFEKAVRVHNFNKKINFKEVNKDLQTFSVLLKARLPFKEYMRLDAADNKILMLGRFYRDYSFSTPALDAFFEFNALKESLNDTLLLSEEEELFWNMLAAQSGGSLQRQALSFLQVMHYAKKLMEGRILAYEYSVLTAGNGDFENAFRKFLDIDLPENVMRYYNLSKEFYDINEQRNFVFIDKAQVSASAQKEEYPRKKDLAAALRNASTVKVLVTGGYHSRGICEILDGRGVSYAVLTPNVVSGGEFSDAGALYESAILNQGKAVSAMQKLISLDSLMISDDIFNMRAFCNTVLLYEYIDFFEQQIPGQEKEKAYELFLEGLKEQINESISNEDNKIKEITVKTVGESKDSYELQVSAETADGQIIDYGYDSVKAARPGRGGIFSRAAGFFKAKLSLFFTKTQTHRVFDSRVMLKKIRQDNERLGIILEYCEQYSETEDIAFLGDQLITMSNSLIRNATAVIPLLKSLSDDETDAIKNEIVSASERYLNIAAGGYYFGRFSGDIYSNADRLSRLLKRNNIVFEDAASDENFTHSAYAQEEVHKKLFSAVEAYMKSPSAASELPVFAYASSFLRAGKTAYDFNYEDRSLLTIKDKYFGKIFLRQKPEAKKAEEALKKQAAEIISYFKERNLDAENQENVESALIRSIIAVQTLAEYAGADSVKFLISLSEEISSLMREKIDIKASEEKYLALVNTDKEDKISAAGKEYGDKAEYARRIVFFQDELIRNIANLGAKDISDSQEYREAALNFLISAANGDSIGKSGGMEGSFWVKQNAVLRLKEFNSEAAVKALNEIIETERSGAPHSADSLFMAMNLESSNAKRISLLLQASYVLIDFKRQDAKALLKKNKDEYFKELLSAPGEEVFAYIAAANDVLSGTELSGTAKNAVFAEFAGIDNEQVLFASMILLDLALERASSLYGTFSAKESGSALSFIKAFAGISFFDGNGQFESIRKDLEEVSSYDELSALVGRMHAALGNMGTKNGKADGWLDNYKFYILSGGGVTEEVVKLDDLDISGETISLMSGNDDGGSSLVCRGDNAYRNGIMTVAPGDVVNFITASAFLENSNAPLRNVIKDFMGYRFTETGSMSETVEKLKSKMKLKKLAKDAGAEKEFEKFWNDIIFYAKIVDEAGFKIEGNSVKNLIFEGMAADNLAYGKGFMNPDGVYAAMKDFADLLGVQSMAVTNAPYGNIVKVKYKGGGEILGQSNISHKSANISSRYGMPREFWFPETVGNVFDDINIKARPVTNLKNAKIIIAGLCSWLTSLGIQLANKDVATAIADNTSSDKILITNPVKDDENRMPLRESSFDFIERVTGIQFERLFNKIFVWGKPEKRRFSNKSFLTNIDVYEGKAGGYQGYNGMAGEDFEVIAKRGIQFREIVNGLGIRLVPRRDDRTKINYKVAADPKVFSEYFWSFLSSGAKKYFTQKHVSFFSAMINETKFSNATALVFADGERDVQAKNSERAQQGINTFAFIPVSRAQARERMLTGRIKSAKNYPGLLSPGIDSELFFSVKNVDGVLQTECYYINDSLGSNVAGAQEELARWFVKESPFLLSSGLINYEDVSLIESSESKADFGKALPEIAPFKVLASETSSSLFDISLSIDASHNTSEFIGAVLEGFKKSINDNAAKIMYFEKNLNWSDINQNPEMLEELKKFLISIDAWEQPVKRAGMMHALKQRYGMSVTNRGVHFINSEGKKLNYYIDANGKFQASDNYLKKMEELASLKIFADMDDNIAPREKPFSDEMKEVFSELVLYGICPPVVVSGNTKKTMGVRFDSLSLTVKEMISYYSELGAVRYEWRESRNEEEFEESGEFGFFIDEYYVRNVSKAEITADAREDLRSLVGNVDNTFDSLYVEYVKATHNVEGFEAKAAKALAAYAEDEKALSQLKKITEKKTKEELIQYWGTLEVSDVVALLAEAEEILNSKQKRTDLGITEPVGEQGYMQILELFSLLEYARITYSQDSSDQKNRAVILREKHIEDILNGEYSKASADTEVRVALVPIRVTHIKDKIADYYEKKVTKIDKYKHLKVESSGRTTINIMKRSTNKTVPIRHEMEENGTPPSKVMYSGDEVLKRGSSEATAGIDDAVAKLNEEQNGQMFVINTNLEEHDIEKRPNLVYARKVFDKNGIKAETPVDIGSKMHAMILQRLEFNIDRIASDDEFEPENIIQVVKESVNSGFLDFAHYDLMKTLKNDDMRLVEIDRRMQEFRDNINWNKINENPKLLAELKQFLRDIGVWDDPAVRAGFLYALKNKFMTRITGKGFFFVDSNGEPLAFRISPKGKFKASKKYMENMRELASLRVFSDFDGNIAELGEEFDGEMTEIFSNLVLYGLCSPSVISGSTHDRIEKRFRPLSEAVKEMITFYSDMGSQRYVWRASENDAEYKEGGTLNFFRDNEYSQKIARADISESDAEHFKEMIPELDSMFDSDYVNFIKKTRGLSTYGETAAAALSGYSSEDSALKVVMEAVKVADKKELAREWKDYNFAEVKKLLDGLKEKGSFTEREYLEILKAVALLEYSRIMYSQDASDAKDKELILNGTDIEQILDGSYVKNIITSPTRIRFTPIRLANVRNKIIDMLNEKLISENYSAEYEAILGGPVTVSIQKKHVKKSMPIEIELERGLPGAKVMFTGDEVFLKGSAPASAGIDDSVALLAMSKHGSDMSVISTNLEEHDTQARPELIYAKRAFDLSGEPVASSVDVGKRMHKMILERLEYNMGEIVRGKKKFKAENVIQSVKETIKAGFVDFFVLKGDVGAFADRIEKMREVRGTKHMLSAA